VAAERADPRLGPAVAAPGRLAGAIEEPRGTLWAIPLRAHGILQAGRSRPRYESGATGIGKLGEWQQAEGDQRDRAAQKVFARAGSRKPRSDQRQECSTTDNHGYRRLACRRPIKQRRTTHGYRVNLGPAGGELQDFRPDFSRPLLSRPCGFIDSSQPAIFATSARCPKTEEPERRSPASWDRTGTAFGGERRLDSAGDLWWVASEGFFSSISLAVGRIISACRPSPTL
jgi:hypothetical protein